MCPGRHLRRIGKYSNKMWCYYARRGTYFTDDFGTFDMHARGVRNCAFTIEEGGTQVETRRVSTCQPDRGVNVEFIARASAHVQKFEISLSMMVRSVASSGKYPGTIIL